MKYIMKFNTLYDQSGRTPQAKLKHIFFSPENRVYSAEGMLILKTKIQTRQNCPPKLDKGHISSREFVLLSGTGEKLAVAWPDYREEKDSKSGGWPIYKTPRVDHARMRLGTQEYHLYNNAARNYHIINQSGERVLQVSVRQLAGIWNIEANDFFTPGVVCGIVALIRYMEYESEFIVV